jgi:hypothetical protein
MILAALRPISTAKFVPVPGYTWLIEAKNRPLDGRLMAECSSNGSPTAQAGRLVLNTRTLLTQSSNAG